IYSFVGFMAMLTICAYALLHYCQTLHSGVSSIHFGASKNEVVALLGAPTRKYEPAIGPDDKPDPNGAVWYYEIRVFPFKVQYRFEFRNDKVDGMGGDSY